MSALKLIVHRSSFIANCLIALIFLLTTTYYLLPINAFAQTVTPSAQVINPYSFTSPLSPQYTNIMAINLIHTLSCLAEGVSIIGQPCIEYSFQNNGQGLKPVQTQYLSSGGAMGSIFSFLTALYTNPPLNTNHYLTDVGQNLHIIPEAHAQVAGSGNNVLSPILDIWKVTRNISYLAMIIIFIAIGFMIMFRQKINPQTVISAQAALPGLVVGLILITFSYFLAALVVDLTFVGVRVTAGVFEGAVLKPGETDNLLKSGNILTIYNSFINKENLPTVVGTTVSTVDSLKTGPIANMLTTFVAVQGCIIGSQLNIAGIFKNVPLLGATAQCAGGGLIGTLLTKVGLETGAVGGIAGLILYVILLIALLIALFRTLFVLIISYITLIITTIAAPFYFLYASIPGKQGAATAWFKTMFANILVFPAVFTGLIFAAYFLGSTDVIKIAKQASFPTSTVPLLGGLNSDFLKIVLAYGILLITPSIPDAVKEAFGVKTSPLGGAAVGALGAGASLGQETFGRLAERLQKRRQAIREARMMRRYQRRDAQGNILEPQGEFYETLGNE